MHSDAQTTNVDYTAEALRVFEAALHGNRQAQVDITIALGVSNYEWRKFRFEGSATAGNVAKVAEFLRQDFALFGPTFGRAAQELRCA